MKSCPCWDVLLAETCPPLTDPQQEAALWGHTEPFPAPHYLGHVLPDNFLQKPPRWLQKHQHSCPTVGAKAPPRNQSRGTLAGTRTHPSPSVPRTVAKAPGRPECRDTLPTSSQGRRPHRSALWESENRLPPSVSFMIVQSNTSPASVLKVFPVGADGSKFVSEVPGPREGERPGPRGGAAGLCVGQGKSRRQGPVSRDVRG